MLQGPLPRSAALTATEAVPAAPSRRSLRALRIGATLTGVLLLLFGVPWWTLIGGGHWPTAVTAVGTAVFLGALVAMPVLMVTGHGARGSDATARVGDTLLGVIWVL